MENMEQNRPDLKGPDQQIQLVLNSPDTEEDSIDLGNVFRNMKQKRRIFAWVLVLCLLVGICAPLLMYQFTKQPLTVSSLVTLRYETPVKVQQRNARGEMVWVVPENPEYEEVSDLTAPDGEELNLSLISSSYVLQSALSGVKLSTPITASQLGANLQVNAILTEESQRTKETLEGLHEAKSNDAYNQLRSAEMKYQNRFVVSLTNGFGDEDSRVKIQLKDEELRLLLNRVLSAYNDYLVMTYADLKLPEDQLASIDTENLDVLDSLDQVRGALESLNEYCAARSEQTIAYRSWKTGRTLTDWTETLELIQSTRVDYLYSMVSENGMTLDKNALMTGWRYQLRTARNRLDEVNENISETKKILASYKNDDVYVSMQESDAIKETKAVSDYYNTLVLQMLTYYDEAAKLKTTIADYESRISRMDAMSETEVTEAVRQELEDVVTSARDVYAGIRAHMEEIFQTPMYTTYELHSGAQGKEVSILSASAKKMIIGAVAGAVIAFGLWFLAALAPEFMGGRKNREKEAA